VIANNSQFADFDVHRAGFIASLAVDAGIRVSPQRGGAEQVKDALESSVRTGILTPGTLHEQRRNDGKPQDYQTANRDLAAPEIEERKVRIEIGKYQCHRSGGHEDDPDQDEIAKISQHIIDFGRDKVIVAFFEDLPANFCDPFLERAQGADPAAKNWTGKQCQHDADDHQDQRGLMHFLHEGARGNELIQADNATKRTQCVQ